MRLRKKLRRQIALQCDFVGLAIADELTSLKFDRREAGLRLPGSPSYSDLGDRDKQSFGFSGHNSICRCGSSRENLPSANAVNDAFEYQFSEQRSRLSIAHRERPGHFPTEILTSQYQR